MLTFCFFAERYFKFGGKFGCNFGHDGFKVKWSSASCHNRRREPPNAGIDNFCFIDQLLDAKTNEDMNLLSNEESVIRLLGDAGCSVLPLVCFLKL